MGYRFDHFNINVSDMARSVAFYERALGLKVAREVKPDDGYFALAFLTDGEGAFRLELTWLRDHEGAYELGENESHLCLTAEDFAAAKARHAEMGCVCFENHAMGLYFIEDPDGYWIEIVPAGRGRGQEKEGRRESGTTLDG